LHSVVQPAAPQLSEAERIRRDIVKLALEKAKEEEIRKKHPFMHIFLNKNIGDGFFSAEEKKKEAEDEAST